VDAAILPHFTHKGWSAFFGWGTTRYGCSMACQASATCSSSGHVPSAAVGEGLTPTVNLPMSRLRRVSLSSWVPAAAASASAARVVLLVLPALHLHLMVVWCVVCGRLWRRVVTYVAQPLLGRKSKQHRNSILRKLSTFYLLFSSPPHRQIWRRITPTRDIFHAIEKSTLEIIISCDFAD
jgi:hypothetical protein